MSTVNVGHGELLMMRDELNYIRGDRLRERRLRLKLTQEEASDKAGINTSYWSQLETNKAENPGLATMRRVAQAVETSVSYLIGETDDPRPIVTDNEPLHSSEYWAGGRGVLDPEDILILERAYLAVMERRRRRREAEPNETDH